MLPLDVLASQRVRLSHAWTPDDVVRLLLANAVGGVLIFVGWFVSSGTGHVSSDLVWLVVALIGLGVAGTANGLFIARSLQACKEARIALFSPPERPPTQAGQMASSTGTLSMTSPTEDAEDLHQLPPDLRSALVLKDQVGLSYPEIAEMLSVSVAEVRSRTADGRAALASLLVGESSDTPP